MPRRLSTPIQHNENGSTRKGEYSLIPSNQYCWLKRITPDKGATCQKVKCSTLNRMIEETLAAEIEVNSDKAVMAGRLKGEILTNGKQTETVPETIQA